jgi:hypothetical protein
MNVVFFQVDMGSAGVLYYALAISDIVDSTVLVNVDVESSSRYDQ